MFFLISDIQPTGLKSKSAKMFQINRTTAKIMTACGALCFVVAAILVLGMPDQDEFSIILAVIALVVGVLMIVGSLAFYTTK